MGQFKKSAGALLCATLLGVSSTAFAAFTTYFGEDLNGQTSTPLTVTPNASGAATTFLGRLIGTGTETFDGFATGSTPPLSLTFPGAGTATLSGGTSVLTGASAGGRYPISGANYYQAIASATSGAQFAVDFSNPIAAFGFYGTDIGDFGTQLTLVLTKSTGGTVSVVVPHSIGTGTGSPADAAALFFGLIGETSGDLFTRVAFSLGAGAVNDDFIGIDNLTIGSLTQVQPPGGSVPEPGSLALLALALGAGVGTRKRRSS